jgi:hypothetical protein
MAASATVILTSRRGMRQRGGDIGGFLSCEPRDASSRILDGDGGDQPAAPVLPAAGMPLAQIPPALLAQLNELHSTLGYSRLEMTPRPD